MTSPSFSTDDDVRRSLDVLDKVLSEFDDIDPSSSSDRSVPSPATPPPVDRSLKPRLSPPTLPIKTKKRTHECQSKSSVRKSASGIDVHSSSNSEKSLKSKPSSSDSSIHEYQEINSELLGHSRKSNRTLASTPTKSEEASRNLTVPEKDSHLRKSRSGEVSLANEDHLRQRRNGRRQVPRRTRSSDHITGARYHQKSSVPMDPIFVDQRLLEYKFYDPLLLDPKFDPSLVDPLLLDPKFDPRLMDPLLMDPRLLDATTIPLMDSRRYPTEDPVRFPHLMTLPGGLPGPALVPFDPIGYPHTIPRYSELSALQDHLLNEELLMNAGHIPVHDLHGPFEPLMSIALPYPGQPFLDLPVNYPIDIQRGQMIHRERLDPEGSRIPRYRHLRRGEDQRLAGPRHPAERHWLPPSPEEAERTIQKIVRNRDRLTANRCRRQDREMAYKHSKPRRFASVGQSESSGTSSPLEEGRQSGTKVPKSRHRSGGGYHPQGREERVDRRANVGDFLVGEAVRKEGKRTKEFGGKDTISLPQFVSGGKDSGFDESPVTEESVLKYPSAGASGGQFVVAGVFNASSKMYIPAPPSPTPDYDSEEGGSAGEESDIPHEPFYVASKEAKTEQRKSSSSSNRNSISEDSLQEKIQRVVREKAHNDGCYSDDSLEEQSLTSSGGDQSRANCPDGSASDVDKRLSRRRNKAKLVEKTSSVGLKLRSGNSSTTRTEPAKVQEPAASSDNFPKPSREKGGANFEVLRNLIKEGLIEGLDESPPDFEPPPFLGKLGKSDSTSSEVPAISTSSASEERADSGIGSSVSTFQLLDENDSTKRKRFSDDGLSDFLIMERSSTPPPLPPPRESSVPSAPQTSKLTPHSKRTAPLRPAECIFTTKVVECSSAPVKKSSSLLKNKKKEKITHVDDITRNKKDLLNGNSSVPSKASHLQLVNREYVENKKNGEMTKGVNDNLSLILEDEASSVSSRGSRKTGRFFSRITESMKSNNSNRSNSPASKGSNRSRDRKTKRVGAKFHGDVIREPNQMLRSPSEVAQFPPPLIGSGRFRSIEDLARTGPQKKDTDDMEQKKKKHATLPPNLTPAAIKGFATEDKNTTNAHVVECKPKKGETEGSKFKFNIFKGFWRRNKYSFEKS